VTPLRKEKDNTTNARYVAGKLIERLIIEKRWAIYASLAAGAIGIGGCLYYIFGVQLPERSHLIKETVAVQKELKDIPNIKAQIQQLSQKTPPEQVEKDKRRLFQDMSEISFFLETVTENIQKSRFVASATFTGEDNAKNYSDYYGIDLYKIPVQLTIRNIDASGERYKELLNILENIVKEDKAVEITKVVILGSGNGVAEAKIDVNLWSKVRHE